MSWLAVAKLSERDISSEIVMSAHTYYIDSILIQCRLAQLKNSRRRKGIQIERHHLISENEPDVFPGVHVVFFPAASGSLVRTA
jgi:hypothetical protein